MAGDHDMNDALLAIVAHGVIAPACSVHLALTTLLAHLEDLDTTTTRDILERAEERARFLIDSLYDVARGLPPEAQRVLAGLAPEA